MLNLNQEDEHMKPKKVQVRVLLNQDEEGGGKKVWQQCSRIDCRNWHVVSSATAAAYDQRLFVCVDALEECRNGYKRATGTSQERWFETHQENVDWIWVDAENVVGGVAAAEGVDVGKAGELETLKAYIEMFSLSVVGKAGADQSDPDEIFAKIDGLTSTNQVTGKSHTLNRFLKEANKLKLFYPNHKDGLKGSHYRDHKGDYKAKELAKIIKETIWKDATLEQQTSIIKALREPVISKLATLERELGGKVAHQKAEHSDNTIALVVHALCDPENYNLIKQAREKVDKQLKPESLAQGIAVAQANQYKPLVARAIERRSVYTNTLTLAQVGDEVYDALKSFDATQADLSTSTADCALFKEIEKTLVAGVERVKAAFNVSGQHKTFGPDMLKEMWQKYSLGGGAVTVNVGVFYAIAFWWNKDLSFLSASLGSASLDSGGLRPGMGSGHGPRLAPRVNTPSSFGGSDQDQSGTGNNDRGDKAKTQKSDLIMANAVVGIASSLVKRTHAATMSDEAAKAESEARANAADAKANSANAAASREITTMLQNGSWEVLVSSDEDDDYDQRERKKAAFKKELQRKAKSYLVASGGGLPPLPRPPVPPT
jgi:hypothetical protein